VQKTSLCSLSVTSLAADYDDSLVLLSRPIQGLILFYIIIKVTFTFLLICLSFYFSVLFKFYSVV